MRTTLRILLLTLLAAATALILSCGPPPVSINDRLSMFVTSLNGNRSDTYTNTDPGAGNYGPAKTPNYWNAAFPTTGDPWTIVPGYDTSNPSSVMVTFNASGTLYATYKMVMVNNKNMGSDNWLINGIFLGATQLF